MKPLLPLARGKPDWGMPSLMKHPGGIVVCRRPILKSFSTAGAGREEVVPPHLGRCV